MFCTQCGSQIADSARFCTICGKPVGLPPAAAVAGEIPGAIPGEIPDDAPRRRLRRIPSKGKIAGVCAGFAEYFDTDVTLMRIIWIALLLLPPGIGLIAYIVAWAVLPKD